MRRRQFLSTGGVIATAAIAGCSSLGAEESGTVRAPDERIYNFDVEEGQTIRIEIDNEEGQGTDTILVRGERGTDGNEDVLEEFVETEATLTHTAEQSEMFRVLIYPVGTASYEIHIED